MEKLNEYRAQIDTIDERLLELFIERMNIVKNIADIKKNDAIDVYDRSREYHMIHRLCEKNNGRIEDMYIKELFQHILKLSKEMQNKIKEC